MGEQERIFYVVLGKVVYPPSCGIWSEDPPASAAAAKSLDWGVLLRIPPVVLPFYKIRGHPDVRETIALEHGKPISFLELVQ